MKTGGLRVKFIALWSVLLLAKLLLAGALPLFVDEAFYSWEGRFPAWAYSDLPGLTAFLAGLGATAGATGLLALRLPFIVLGAAVPWLVVRISRRWFGDAVAWQAGLLAMLMPLSGLLGVLALPDVPLVFAALLCVEAIARLRERIAWPSLVLLAAALAIGALSHYRFALVVAAGLAGMLCDPRSRSLLRSPGVWTALAAGALAWLPLALWNLGHQGAGFRFQLVERNPWAFHLDGLAWLPIQFLLVTPFLFALLVATLLRAWRERDDQSGPAWGLLAGTCAVSVPGYFLLGFFADQQRVSFHWPLSGWLLLIVAAPVLLRDWRPLARAAVFVGAGLGLVVALAFLACASRADWRSALADSRFYPADFAGWQEISGRARQWDLPPGAVIVASNFELGAELAFALDRGDIRVLDSAINHKHGRATQLQAWGLQLDEPAATRARPMLLVLDDTATPMKHRLLEYQRLCALFGKLPPADVLSVDHGRKRYFVYRIEAALRRPGCSAPALAWIDAPAPKGRVGSRFTVAGWAFKDGPGLAAVEITIDGEPMAMATYGLAMPNVAQYWMDSGDPNQPNVGFRAELDAGALAPGRHWLGLRLHGADGSVEPWVEQRIRIDRP